MNDDTTDTRDDGSPHQFALPMTCGSGEGAELRVFLEEALQIPRNARRFCVTFEVGKAVLVSVDYIPRAAGPAVK
jgi:hypothetical protein